MKQGFGRICQFVLGACDLVPALSLVCCVKFDGSRTSVFLICKQGSWSPDISQVFFSKNPFQMKSCWSPIHTTRTHIATQDGNISPSGAVGWGPHGCQQTESFRQDCPVRILPVSVCRSFPRPPNQSACVRDSFLNKYLSGSGGPE